MMKNLHGSPNNSVSGEDDVISDHEDPVHNESILNELFYKTQLLQISLVRSAVMK